ncbi:hypothetical protein BGZ93_007525 [Podila epicladia]|nr:hypothetical protein BGZ92_000479 [Podila epicladia]KAG0094128.1 hypothetical protein BGZ93_007525 [Podila epicladia]
MTHPTYEDDTVKAANDVSAAIVAAVAAGNSTFTDEGHLESMHIEALDTIEPLDTAAIETIVAGNPSLKRPAEDDEDDMEDSVKLRKLQEEVNNNTNAAAQASGILSSSTMSSHTSAHTSTNNSTHNSPHASSSPLETHVPTTPATHGSPMDVSPLPASDTNDVATPTSNTPASASVSSTISDKKKASQEVAPEVVAAAAGTTTISESSYERIMADVERIRELAKIDPTQLASYSTNPNNQAAIEQLTSSALANVLAQAPALTPSLQATNAQLEQQHQQEDEQQQKAIQGILASMPTPNENSVAAAQDSSSSQDDDGPGKRSSNRDATNDERRQRRLLRNRVAAKECRKKKKAYVKELQDTCAFLKEENAKLYKEIEELNAKLTLGAMRADENVRLIKEVEELNAKLTMGVMVAPTSHVSEEVVTIKADAPSSPVEAKESDEQPEPTPQSETEAPTTTTEEASDAAKPVVASA